MLISESTLVCISLFWVLKFEFLEQLKIIKENKI